MKSIILFILISCSAPNNDSSLQQVKLMLKKVSILEDNNWFVFENVNGNRFHVFSKFASEDCTHELKINNEYILSLKEINHITNSKGIGKRLNLGVYDLSQDTTIIEGYEKKYVSDNIIGKCYIVEK